MVVRDGITGLVVLLLLLLEETMECVPKEDAVLSSSNRNDVAMINLILSSIFSLADSIKW